MSENDIKKMIALDNAAEEAGGYVDSSPVKVHYNYREINRYCKDKGIEP